MKLSNSPDGIEERAKALDQHRKVRQSDIDVAKYEKLTEIKLKVREASAYLLEILDSRNQPAPPKPLQMPWTKTWGEFEFRLGEVTVYAGSNGGGKSLLTGQIALSLVSQGERVCIASFEMKPVRTLTRMLRQFSGENVEGMTYPQEALAKTVVEFDTFSQSKLWLYDQQGTTDARSVVAMARYCAMELGIRHIFIDSLMKCVQGEDDYNAQKNFIDELTALARDHDVHIHLVHHIRKLLSEEAQPNKFDLKGSGAITDQVDNVFVVWRNKKKETAQKSGGGFMPYEHDLTLMCEKQRNGDIEEWYKLWYHRESQSFCENEQMNLVRYT